MKTLKQFLFFIAITCFSVNVFGQVGINTTNPNASLDIRSSNAATPTNTDGILIPKIDEYPIINPTAAQDGMLVYATGNGSVTKGFYYWNNTTTSWATFSGTTIEKIDDLIDGKSDNDGTDNGSSIFIGVDAGLNDDSTSNSNVGVGFQALKENISGTQNSAYGYFALSSNITGNYNSAFGKTALYSNTGTANSAFGFQSMYSNTTGTSNSAFGTSSLLLNTTGKQNTAIGTSSLYNNSIGDHNVVLGYNALYQNTTGSDNIAIGYRAGYSEINSNRLYIENSDSTSPLIYGEFDNDLVRVNGDFEVEKTTDARITVKTPFGDKSSLKLFESGGSGDYGFEFQYDGSPDKLYLWSRTFAGNEGIRMTWLKNGRVGINDISPTALLDMEASNSATPTNTDGILIPRIDAFPSSNPTADQNGMLVFLTTDNTFYFWRNSTTSWVSINSSGSQSINDLTDGKSDVDGTDDGSSVFLGINAGINDDSSGNRNVGIGFNSLHLNTTGYHNSAFGYRTLEDNTTGNNNSGFGAFALYGNTTGDDNSAFGGSALYKNTVGNNNTAFGISALWSNTTGNNNSAFGGSALYKNTTGNNNSAFGYHALNSNTGQNNAAFGNNTLFLNATGSGNSAFGNLSLYNNTTGNYNVAIGNGSLETNTTANFNVAIGFEALHNSTSGYRNTAVGYNTLINVTTGDNNTALGSHSGPLVPGLSNSTAIGYNAVPLGSNWVRIGNSSVSIIGGSATWSVFSDRRLKTNIREDIAGLDFIKKLRPVSYNLDMDAIALFEKTPDSLRLRDAELLKAQEVQTGFIAQEVETAANQVGFDFHGIVKPYDSNGTYALRYAEFVVPLVKGMQEQQNIIESQQEDINTLKREIEEIKALLRQD